MPSAALSSAPLVLIHGDDGFAVRERAHQYLHHWATTQPGWEQEIIDAQAGNTDEALRALSRLWEAVHTLPMFGAGKVVWLQNCTFLGEERVASSEAVTDALAQLAEQLKGLGQQNVRLLITAGSVDRRRSFYKAVEKLGAVEHFPAWSLADRFWTAEAQQWARERLAQHNQRISPAALETLLELVGPDRQQLATELEKLSLYVAPRQQIEQADVEAVVTRHKQARAFALVDALGERHLPNLLRALDEALWEVRLDSKKSELGLLYSLISKVRLMILAKELVREGWMKPSSSRDPSALDTFKRQLARVPADRLPTDPRFNPLAANPYPLFKALVQSANYTLAELIRAMRLLLECNQRLISSSLDEALVLQQTLIEIVRRSPQPASRAAA
jgi:DNA polymerase-3 subunit delta